MNYSNTKLAIQMLKKALREHGVTYADVAVHLDMSEASIKKMFSTCHFTLERIEMICGMIDMDFIDLLRLFDVQRHRISRLSEEQEKGLVKNKRLLLVAILARNQLLFDEILESFQITTAELYADLKQLEQLRLLELHPNNRIKWLVASNFQWITNGPIERFVEVHILDGFLAARFHKHKERRVYLGGLLTEAARDVLLRQMDKLERLFVELMEESSHSPIAEKKNITLFAASRGWESPFISERRREKLK